MARRWVQAARGVARLSGDSRDAAFHIRQRETRHSRTRPFPSRQRTYLQGGKALQPRLRGRPHPTRPGGRPSTPSARPSGPGGLPRPAVRRGREPPREGARDVQPRSEATRASSRLNTTSKAESSRDHANGRFKKVLGDLAHRHETAEAPWSGRRPRPAGSPRGARGEHAGPSERG